MDRTSKKITGIVTQLDILRVFEQRFREERHRHTHISMTRSARRAIWKGKRLFKVKTNRDDRKKVVTELVSPLCNEKTVFSVY